MKLIQILKEIKIQQPGSNIILTDKGKQAIEDIGNLRNILQTYCEEPHFQEVFHDSFQTKKLIIANTLSIFVDEKYIFEDKPTPLE